MLLSTAPNAAVVPLTKAPDVVYNATRVISEVAVDTIWFKPCVAPDATPPVRPPIRAYFRTPLEIFFPSATLAKTLVPAPAAIPPARSAPTLMPILVAVLAATPQPAPAKAPPAIEIGAAITPPAAPIPA